MKSLSPKRSVLCATVVLGALAAASAPASAHYYTTRCNDGYCYQVRCDDDGDDCDRVSGHYRPYYYEPRYHGGYYGGYYGNWGYPSFGFTYYGGDHAWRHHEEDEDEDE